MPLTFLQSAVPFLRPLSLLAAAAIGMPMLRAQHPPLLTVIPAPPAAAVAWDAAEQARSPMIVRTEFVQVDTNALAALPAGGAPPLGTFSVDLFGRVVTLEITGRDWTLDHHVFRGHVVGQPSEARLVLATGGIAWGSITLGDDTFVIAHTGVANVHVLQAIDPSRLPPHMVCGTNRNHEVAEPTMSSLVSSLTSNCSLTTIDVMVFYTPAARQNAGGVAAIETAITGAVANANAANVGSGVPAEFRLVHMAETTYTELGTSTDLSRFRNTTDGFMDEVHGKRATYGADLMHLITDPTSASYCGIAYLMTNLSTNFKSSAFGVTVRGCLSGGTFAHESGHNLGCAHDVQNAGAALYPYSYGYRTPNNQYRTVMAYSPGQRINRWSSPNVTHNGFVMGVAGETDNALTITNSCGTAAQFFATQAPRWCALSGGIPGSIGEPVLSGSGTINLADPLRLTVSNYRPNALGVSIVGTSAVDVPAFGGTIVPSLDVLNTITGNGTPIVQNVDWLSTLPPGFQVWFQSVFLDPTAVQGLSASDGVKVTVP